MQVASFGQQYSSPAATAPTNGQRKAAPKFGFEPITCCTVGCIAPIAIIGGIAAALFIIKGLIKKFAGAFHRSPVQ